MKFSDSLFSGSELRTRLTMQVILNRKHGAVLPAPT